MSTSAQTLSPAVDWNTTRRHRSSTLTASGSRPNAEAPSPVVVDRYEGYEKRVVSDPQKKPVPFSPIPETRPIAPGKATSFAVSQEWEGVVKEVGISHFTALLRSVGAKDDGTDILEIPIGDIPRASRDMLTPGAIFRYLAGYATDRSGTVQRKRLVYFRKGRARPAPKLVNEWMEIVEYFRVDD